MLAKFWRLRMVNKTGEIMTYADAARIAIRTMGWKMSGGDLVYGSVITEDLGFTTGTIANNGEVEGTVRENTTDLLWGVNGTFEIIHDLDAAVGSCDLYLEVSDNDGNWPSDSLDFDIVKDLILISSLKIDNTGTDKSRSKNFAF